MIDLKALNVSWAGAGGHSGARSVRWTHSGSETHVLIDLNGDREADMLIRLSGHHNLGSGDFLL